jgi:hypothetical protein
MQSIGSCDYRRWCSVLCEFMRCFSGGDSSNLASTQPNGNEWGCGRPTIRQSRRALAGSGLGSRGSPRSFTREGTRGQVRETRFDATPQGGGVPKGILSTLDDFRHPQPTGS